MAHSCGRGRTEKPAFSSTTPHFFKIVLEETLQENKLRIPKKFERKYGETLSKDVFVKLPCGSEWKMGLEKCNGMLWLKEGCPEFLRHYTLKRGHLLVFRYEGNSKFSAVIFDDSTMEMDYPIAPDQFDEPDIGEEHQESKGKETKESDSVETSKDFSFSPEKQSSSWHQKRRKIGHTSNKTKCETSKPKTKGDGDKPTTFRQRKSDVLEGMKSLSLPENEKSLQMAEGFKSKNPFFKVVMQPSYVIESRLKIPIKFARKHLKDKDGLVTLKVSGGKTWSVDYNCKVYGNIPDAKFYNGWNLFSQENNLDIGDVCVFVLTKDKEVSFDVTIFHSNENSNSSNSDGASNQAN